MTSGGGKDLKNSQKGQKFKELAESRTNKALDAIGRIGNLSNTALYEWEEADLKKIMRALKESVSEVEARFDSPRGKPGARFRL